MNAMKVIPIGNSTGVVLPRELLTRLRVARGDMLYATEAADGSIRLTPYRPGMERQMEAGEKIMREDRDILRVLAQ